MAHRHPQAAYSAMQMLLQAEWQFVRRVTKGTLADISPIKAAMKHKFLPGLFGEGKVTADSCVLT